MWIRARGHGRPVRGYPRCRDPVEVARRYDDQGSRRDHFLDITASHEGRDTMVHTVERMASEVFILLTVGGGIRKLEDIRTMLNAGADKVSINTAAVFEPEFVGRAADRFGSQHRRGDRCEKVSGAGEPDRWEIFTHGGRKPTGLEAIAWARKWWIWEPEKFC